MTLRNGEKHEAEVILEAKRMLEETPKRSFRSDSEIWDWDRFNAAKVNEKLWKLSKCSGAKSRNFLAQCSLWQLTIAGRSRALKWPKFGCPGLTQMTEGGMKEIPKMPFNERRTDVRSLRVG